MFCVYFYWSCHIIHIIHMMSPYVVIESYRDVSLSNCKEADVVYAADQQIIRRNDRGAVTLCI